MAQRRLDIAVENHGSLFLFRPMSDQGAAWLAENLDPQAQRFGDAYVVEPRYAYEIGFGAQHAGLEVR